MQNHIDYVSPLEKKDIWELGDTKKMFCNIFHTFSRQKDRARMNLPMGSPENEIDKLAYELRFQLLHLAGTILFPSNKIDDQEFKDNLEGVFSLSPKIILPFCHNPGMPNGIRHLVRNILTPREVKCGIITSNFGPIQPLFSKYLGCETFTVGDQNGGIAKAMHFLLDENVPTALLIAQDEANQASPKRRQNVSMLNHIVERPTGPLEIALRANATIMPIWFQGYGSGTIIHCSSPFLPQKNNLANDVQRLADFETKMKLSDPFVI
jgi:hypothetical protein